MRRNEINNTTTNNNEEVSILTQLYASAVVVAGTIVVNELICKGAEVCIEYVVDKHRAGKLRRKAYKFARKQNDDRFREFMKTLAIEADYVMSNHHIGLSVKAKIMSTLFCIRHYAEIGAIDDARKLLNTYTEVRERLQRGKLLKIAHIEFMTSQKEYVEDIFGIDSSFCLCNILMDAICNGVEVEPDDEDDEIIEEVVEPDDDSETTEEVVEPEEDIQD